MAREQIEYVYYMKNVDYFVGVKSNIKDSIGQLLTYENPFVAVDIDHIRDFKIANKRAILEGLIIPVEEPSLDWETENAITDSEIDELLKNFLKLKAKLPKISSLAVAEKILNTAKEQNKSPKILNMIQSHIDGLTELIDDPTFKRGVE